jgi:hypothetical protein
VAKHKDPATEMSLKHALDRLKEQQTLYVPGTHLKPFLTELADFVSGCNSEELAAIQQGQLVSIPLLKRSPVVMGLAEVILNFLGIDWPHVSVATLVKP